MNKVRNEAAQYTFIKNSLYSDKIWISAFDNKSAIALFNSINNHLELTHQELEYQHRIKYKIYA